MDACMDCQRTGNEARGLRKAHCKQDRSSIAAKSPDLQERRPPLSRTIPPLAGGEIHLTILPNKVYIVVSFWGLPKHHLNGRKSKVEDKGLEVSGVKKSIFLKKISFCNGLSPPMR